MRLLIGALIILGGCGGGRDQEQPPTDPGPGPVTPPASIRVELVANGLSQPLHLTAPTGDPRLFIVEKTGRIRIVAGGQLLAAPFLDLSHKVSTGSEQGLLSMAFDPRYATNGFFYVNYTDRQGDTRVERYRVSGNPNVADTIGTELLFIDQPFANHNGGHLIFGPDGLLYIPTGDGGSGGDPQNNAQNRTSRLGKLLRMDVTQANPAPEIVAIGLRNPWRIWFDRADNMLYIADVGQNTLEEINAVPAGSRDLNYGWRIMEGDRCFNPPTGCNQQGLTLPVLTYGRSDGCSVTGGIVYRGTRIPGIRGHYFYSDYCQGWVRSFRLVNGAATDQRNWSVGQLGNVMSYGEDSTGEMYVLTAAGSVYRFVP